MYVTERFKLNTDTINELRRERVPEWGFGSFSEFIFYTFYSRKKLDGSQESWADVVIRVVEGCLSIRKDWYIKNNILWDEYNWQSIGYKMAISLFRMEWLPGGRGLWAMGTSLVYERGGMALANCGFVEIGKCWPQDLGWLMDALMCGCGVGFEAIRDDMSIIHPVGGYDYLIDDSREGWVNSTIALLTAFRGGDMPRFDYSDIRPEDLPIKTFGGTSSGPGPLIELHERITDLCYNFTDSVKLKVDLANVIGCCVVTGNVRRSAELGLCSISDPIFMDLKNYDIHPERSAWGWMSNNSVKLYTDEDFQQLTELAYRVRNRVDIGYVNMRNLSKGRIGKQDDVREDKATGVNACAEIPLESYELCNLAETLPTRCPDIDAWLDACEYATIYCSTVALLPTHNPETNAVLIRNRRIGVSIVDFIGWKDIYGVCNVTQYMRQGYDRIRQVNKSLADAAGIPESIRVTTVKPGGTTPKLAGRRSGIMHHNFTYMIRRIRMQENNPICKLLDVAGYTHTRDEDSGKTIIYEFPLYMGEGRQSSEVSIWEQAMNLVLMQREWADNAVSNTLNYRTRAEYPYNHEEDELEAVLASIAPLTKSVSLMPHTSKGLYRNMPEEGITRQEYIHRISKLKNIDWTGLHNDAMIREYCDGALCQHL